MRKSLLKHGFTFKKGDMRERENGCEYRKGNF